MMGEAELTPRRAVRAMATALTFMFADCFCLKVVVTKASFESARGFGLVTW